MKLACHLLGHRAVPHAVANRGFQFSRCRRCRCDMVRSNQPASSNWIVVPPTFRVAWNDVDPDEMFRLTRLTPLRRVRAALSRIRAAHYRVRAAVSSAIDCVRVSCFVTLVMTRDYLRHLVWAMTHHSPRVHLLKAAKSTPPAGEWRIRGSMDSATAKVRFLYVIRQDQASLVCG